MTKTIKDACYEWVQGFNAIPQGLIEKAYCKGDFYELNEVTPRNYVCSECNNIYTKSEAEDLDYKCNSKNCESKSFENWFAEEYYGKDIVNLTDEELEEIKEEYNDYIEDYDYPELEESEEDEYGCLPMWGTMWTFGDSADEWWVENHLEEMAECGFRIYESDELGYYFGINGAGYDFYESHWIPLYKTRGLKWHEN